MACIRRSALKGRTSTRSGRTASATRRQARLERPVLLSNLHQGPGHGPEEEPVLVGTSRPSSTRSTSSSSPTRTPKCRQCAAVRSTRLMSPTFGANLAPLQSTPGSHVQPTPGYFFEHLDLQFGPKVAEPAPAVPVDAPGDHARHRSPVDHQHGLRLAGEGAQAARQRGLLPDPGGVQAGFKTGTSTRRRRSPC